MTTPITCRRCGSPTKLISSAHGTTRHACMGPTCNAVTFAQAPATSLPPMPKRRADDPERDAKQAETRALYGDPPAPMSRQDLGQAIVCAARLGNEAEVNRLCDEARARFGDIDANNLRDSANQLLRVASAMAAWPVVKVPREQAQAHGLIPPDAPVSVAPLAVGDKVRVPSCAFGGPLGVGTIARFTPLGWPVVKWPSGEECDYRFDVLAREPATSPLDWRDAYPVGSGVECKTSSGWERATVVDHFGNGLLKIRCEGEEWNALKGEVRPIAAQDWRDQYKPGQAVEVFWNAEWIPTTVEEVLWGRLRLANGLYVHLPSAVRPLAQEAPKTEPSTEYTFRVKPVVPTEGTFVASAPGYLLTFEGD